MTDNRELARRVRGRLRNEVWPLKSTAIPVTTCASADLGGFPNLDRGDEAAW